MQVVFMQVAIQVAKAMVKARREAYMPAEPHIQEAVPEEPYRPQQAGLMLRQTTFNRKVPDMYMKLKFSKWWEQMYSMYKPYDLNDEQKVSIIKNSLGWEGLQAIQTLTNAEKGTCKNAAGLFNVLKEKFCLQQTKWCCHHNTVDHIERIMNLHRSGWTDYV